MVKPTDSETNDSFSDPARPVNEDERPTLSQEFFLDLLGMHGVCTGGTGACTGCGRCKY